MKKVLPAALAAILVVGSAEAQVAWDAPLMIQPHEVPGWSFFVFEPDPGDEVGAFVSWRLDAVPVGPRFRVGLAEGADGDVAAFGGFDVMGRLLDRSRHLPLSVVWFAGAGGSVSDEILVSLPAGLSLGRSVPYRGLDFQPWVAPRLVLDARLGVEDGGESEVDLDGVVEAGVDLLLEGGWVVRFGATFAGRDALGVGLTLPIR